MSSIGKTIGKVLKPITSIFTPDIPEPKEEAVLPIPTESTSKIAAEKKQARKAKRSSGRSGTILTEGLGG